MEINKNTYTYIQTYVYIVYKIGYKKRTKEKIILKREYIPNVNFSPESGGNVNPSKAIDDISTHGTIKLKK